MIELEIFFTANGIEDAVENTGRRKIILLSVIGGKNFGLIQNLLAPINPRLSRTKESKKGTRYLRA